MTWPSQTCHCRFILFKQNNRNGWSHNINRDVSWLYVMWQLARLFVETWAAILFLRLFPYKRCLSYFIASIIMLNCFYKILMFSCHLLLSQLLFLKHQFTVHKTLNLYFTNKGWARTWHRGMLSRFLVTYTHFIAQQLCEFFEQRGTRMTYVPEALYAPTRMR